MPLLASVLSRAGFVQTPEQLQRRRRVGTANGGRELEQRPVGRREVPADLQHPQQRFLDAIQKLLWIPGRPGLGTDVQEPVPRRPVCL
jgi:hypothetical protein